MNRVICNEGRVSMTKFSSIERDKHRLDLQNNTLDLLVVGGGITGAGIALDATKRGLQTGLIEMQDFAAGTSSRSTKLIHGGLRYLKQFEVKLVAEVGKERAIVYENGPHVTTPEWMMLPFYKGGTFGPFTTNIGLRVYDFLAGVKKSERRKMFSPEEAIGREPLLAEDGLKGAGYYVEYKTDDARLTIEVVKKAVELGTIASNYVKATEFTYEDNKITGVVARDEITGETFPIHAKKVINATGPWVDDLREVDGSKQGKSLHLTKGVHLVFSKKRFPLEQAIYFDTADKRMIFAIPRGNTTYVGTTDTDYHGDIANPDVTEDDYTYLLESINGMFPSLNLTVDDIESSWAGLRPLIAREGKKPGEISRKDAVFISESGLISMAGGKLTGYRKMAEEAVDIVVNQLKEEEGKLFAKSSTMHFPISGGDVGGSANFSKFVNEKVRNGINIGIDEDSAVELAERYGSNVDVLFEIFTKNKDKAIETGINPVILAELVYAIEYEFAYKPVDFFVRRTGALLFNIDLVNEQKEKITQYMAFMLEWTKEQTDKYTSELEIELKEAML